MELKTILQKLRNKINKIDELILELLFKRRKIAIKIAKKKIINKFPIKDKNREQELLKKLINFGKKLKLSKKYIQEIFNIIIHDSIEIQKKIKIEKKNNNDNNQLEIACIGPKGSYSYIAAIKYMKKYKKNYFIKKYNNFEDIFNSIKKNKFNYAIIPIENNYSGFIPEVYKLLIKKNIKIIGDFYLPIQHCVLTKPNIIFKDIKKIYSHNQAFKQCSNFIKKFHYLKIKYTNSTSEAMKIISTSNKNNIAAIGDKNNSKFYKLNVILENISNQINNKTRFLILNNYDINKINSQKKNITLILKTKQILLFYIIQILYTNKIEIIKLKLNSYHKNQIKEIIYLEIEIKKEKKIKKILKIFEEKDIIIKNLGSYSRLNISK